MKSIFTLVFCILFITVSKTQTQITNIMSGGSSSRYLLKDVDDKSYLMSIDKFDFVSVFILEEAGAVFQHKKYFPGISSEFILKHTENRLLINTLDNSISYDFVNDKILNVPMPEGFGGSTWSNNFENKVLLRQYPIDFEDRRNYIVDLENDIFELLNDSDTYLQTNNTHIIQRKRINDKYDYYFYNIETKESEYFYTGTIYYNESWLDDSYYYYFENNLLKRYSFQDKLTTTVYHINVSHQDIGLKIFGDKILIHFNDEDRNGQIVIVDANDFNVLNNEFIADELSGIYPQIINDKIIYYSFGKLGVLDLKTSVKTIFYSFIHSENDILVVNDSKIIHKWYERFFMIDLNTLIETELPINHSAASANDLTSSRLQNKMYFSYDTNDEDLNSLIEINLNTYEVIKPQLIPNTNIGLQDDTKLEVLDNEIVLLSENLYHISDTIVNQLNTSDLVKAVHHEYKINDEKLSWAQNEISGIGIYSFDGNDMTKHALIPHDLESGSPSDTFILRDYAIVRDLTYFYGYGFIENIKYTYDITNDEISVVGLIEDDLLSSTFEEHNGYLYFESNGLKVLTPQNNVVDLELEYSFVNSPFFKYKNRIFVHTGYEIYELVGTDKTLIVEYEGLNFLDHEIIGDLVLFNDFQSEVYVFDGQELDTIFLEQGEFLNVVNDKFVNIYKSVATNTRKNRIYNIENRKYYDLPADIELQNILAISIINGKLLFVSGDGFWDNQRVTVYEVDNDFTDFKPLDTFTAIDAWRKSSFVPFGNEGLLYVGNRILLMDEDLKFEPLDDLIGDPDQPKIIEQEGYFYFLAFDETDGRQVFRTLAFSKRLTDATIDLKIIEDIKIYPNPANNLLTINSDKLKDKFVMAIYNINGSLVYKEITSSKSIDISDLSNGFYTALVRNIKGDLFKFTFVKATD